MNAWTMHKAEIQVMEFYTTLSKFWCVDCRSVFEATSMQRSRGGARSGCTFTIVSTSTWRLEILNQGIQLHHYRIICSMCMRIDLSGKSTPHRCYHCHMKAQGCGVAKKNTVHMPNAFDKAKLWSCLINGRTTPVN